MKVRGSLASHDNPSELGSHLLHTLLIYSTKTQILPEHLKYLDIVRVDKPQTNPYGAADMTPLNAGPFYVSMCLLQMPEAGVTTAWTMAGKGCMTGPSFISTQYTDHARIRSSISLKREGSHQWDLSTSTRTHTRRASCSAGR